MAAKLTSSWTLLDTACRRDITDLELNVHNQEFDGASIEADVGVTISSITNFSRHLTGVNTRRPLAAPSPCARTRMI